MSDTPHITFTHHIAWCTDIRSYQKCCQYILTLSKF